MSLISKSARVLANHKVCFCLVDGRNPELMPKVPVNGGYRKSTFQHRMRRARADYGQAPSGTVRMPHDPGRTADLRQPVALGHPG